MCDSIKTVSQYIHKFYMHWSWKNIGRKTKSEGELPKWKREHKYTLVQCEQAFFFVRFLLLFLLDRNNSASRVSDSTNLFFLMLLRIRFPSYGYLERKFYTFLSIWWCTSCEFSQPNVLNFHLNIFMLFFFFICLPFFIHIHIGTFRFVEFSLLCAFTVGCTNVLILMNALLTQLNDWIRICWGIT